MKVRADTEVAVLSARTDLDLAISTWLPGYVAQRTDDLDTVMDITRRGGIVLIDLGSPRHEEWVAALREREFDGPTVFLDPRGDMTIDLRDRVTVTSPPSLSGLLAGFEVAGSKGRGAPRRSDRDARSSAPKGRRWRTPATAARDLDAARPSEVEEGAAVVGRARRVGRAQREEPGTPVGRARREELGTPVGRARRVGRAPREEPGTPVGRARRVHLAQRGEPGTPVGRARRVDRRHATQGRSFWGSLLRRRSIADASPSDAETPLATPPPVRIDADAEREFRKLFRTADEQPVVQRRVATPEGRVRVQTEEELFAEHSAAPSMAETGRVLTALPPRQRRVRVDA